jgi:hypothetical protein
MESMRINKSVTSLDLGRNLIGESGTDELMATRGGPMRPNNTTTSPVGYAGTRSSTTMSPSSFRFNNGSLSCDTYATANVASTAYLGFRVRSSGSEIEAQGWRAPTVFVSHAPSCMGTNSVTGNAVLDTMLTLITVHHSVIWWQLIGAKAVAETLRVNTTLLELDLSNNFLREGSASTIAIAMRSNSGLTRLDLSHNAFKDEPARKVRIDI